MDSVKSCGYYWDILEMDFEERSTCLLPKGITPEIVSFWDILQFIFGEFQAGTPQMSHVALMRDSSFVFNVGTAQ